MLLFPKKRVHRFFLFILNYKFEKKIILTKLSKLFFSYHLHRNNKPNMVAPDNYV